MAKRPTNPKTRQENIQAEMKAAAQCGLTPKRPVSNEANFRATKSTPMPFSAGSTMVPTEAEANLNDRDFLVGVDEAELARFSTLLKDTLPERLDPAALKKAVERNIEMLSPDTLERVPAMLSDMNAFVARGGNVRLLDGLRRKLAERVLGKKAFTNARGKYGGTRPVGD